MLQLSVNYNNHRSSWASLLSVLAEEEKESSIEHDRSQYEEWLGQNAARVSIRRSGSRFVHSVRAD